MIRFFIVLSGLTLLVVLGNVWALAEHHWIQPSFFTETLILLVFTTGLLYVYLYKASSDLFVQLYLLSIAIKILAYGGYIFMVVLLDKAGAPGNVAFFMITYFAFTAVEIAFLYHKKTHS